MRELAEVVALRKKSTNGHRIKLRIVLVAYRRASYSSYSSYFRYIDHLKLNFFTPGTITHYKLSDFTQRYFAFLGSAHRQPS